MSTDALTVATSLTAGVAAEIRAHMGRYSISRSELARRLGVDDTWVGKRLNGRTEITLSDLERIAQALRVSAQTLIPGVPRVTNPSHTLIPRQRSQMARNVTPKVRPSDRRPIGRAQASTGPSGQRRTSRVA